MPRFDLSHTPEPALSSHNSGNKGETHPSASSEHPTSSEHPMTLSQCLFVVGLLVLAIVFSYLIVFRIDPIAVDLHCFASHAMSLAAASHGDRQ
jgi:hypothetical protein